MEVGAFIGVAAMVLLVFFGGYLRKVLRAAAGEGEMLSLISFSASRSWRSGWRWTRPS